MQKNGKTPTEISRYLTENGYPVPSDVVGNTHVRNDNEIKRGWNRNAVKRILQNQTYLGYVINGKIKKVNYKSKKRLFLPQNEWIIKKDMHEPIIDKETFDIVQQHIKNRTNKRTRKYEWLLNGLIECEECGKKLSVIGHHRKDGKTTFYLKCNTYSTNTALKLCTPHCNNLSKVTQIVLDTVRQRLKDYLEQEQYRIIADDSQNKVFNKKDAVKKEVQILEKKMQILDKKINELYEDKVNGILTIDDFKRIYADTNETRQNTKNRIESLLESCNNKEQKSIEDLDEIVNKFLSMEEITKTMLVQLIDKITISEEKEIKIYYKFNILNSINELTKLKVC